jgi:hypothetical protein
MSGRYGRSKKEDCHEDIDDATARRRARLVATRPALGRRRRLGVLPAALLAGAALAGPAQAVDFVVTNLNDGGAGSLRQAIEDANGNGMEDTITFDASLAGGTILLSISQLTIADDTAAPDLTVDGDLDDDGMPDITVDANGGSRVFFIAFGANVTLQGLVITGGSNEEGGGIFNDGTLTVANSTISGNSAGFGGGIRNFGTLTVESSTIRDNGADFGGGIENPGTLTVTNSTISGNTARFTGGISNGVGTATVANSTISGNTGDPSGDASSIAGTADSPSPTAPSATTAAAASPTTVCS